MQTEAAPREPFTLRVLLRYKFTIFAVATVVILGGYVKIITQPRQYEATARLAVRFTSEALRLAELNRDSPLRLPLLEEEVKAHVVLLRDPQFINQVLQDMPAEELAAGGPEPPIEPSTVDQFRNKFLKAYYDIRKAFLSALDAVLRTDDTVLSEREQRVMKVASKLEVGVGLDASHIITVSFKDAKPTIAEKMVNRICEKFIELQKRKVKPMDEAKFQKVIDEEMTLLAANRNRFYELLRKVGSPTIEEAIRRHYTTIDDLNLLKARFLGAKSLLEQEKAPFDRTLPLETPILVTELEREFFNTLIRYLELMSRAPEEITFYTKQREAANTHMSTRRKEAMARDLEVVKSEIARIDLQIQKIVGDTTIPEISPEYTRLLAAESILQGRVAKAEAALDEARKFNEQLKDENVSENITLWQRAQTPPFPLPQHRGLKLLVVMALGFFAGAAIALLRHQVLPKPVRRARLLREEDMEMPIIILPDSGKDDLEKDVHLDITFPEDEEEGSRPRR
jgi:capsular polysaccharide biosynthesis protein